MSIASSNTPSPQPFAAVGIESMSVAAVRALTIEDHDRLIDKAVVQLYDRERSITDFVQEGQSLEIVLGWQDGEHAKVFEGIIHRVEAASVAGDRRIVRVTAFDPSFQMMLTPSQMSIAHTGSLSSIITQLVQSHGIAIGAVTPDPDPTFAATDPLPQVGATDWQFIQDLTLAYGGRAFVEVDNDTPKFFYLSEDQLMAQDPVGTLRQCQGFSELKKMEVTRVATWASTKRLSATMSPDSGEVTSAETSVAVPEAPTLPDTEHAAALADRYGSEAAARYVAAASVAVQATGTPDDQRTHRVALGLPSDPNLIAQLERTDPTRVMGLRADGIARGAIALRAKSLVTISGISAWADGDWYLQEVEHIVRMSGGQNGIYETHFTATR